MAPCHYQRLVLRNRGRDGAWTQTSEILWAVYPITLVTRSRGLGYRVGTLALN